MKLGILGGTGGTGQHLVRQALERGHSVLALVRNTSKIEQKHENLQVVETDIFSVEKLQELIQGCDVVMSCLGAFPSFSRITLYSDAIKPLVEAMRATQINRLVVLTSWYSKSTPDEPFAMKWFVKPLILGRVLEDMGRMEDYIEENCQDIDYTVIRPPSLRNGDKEDVKIVAEEGYTVKNGTSITRANVASYMLDSATEETQLHVKEMVAISPHTDKMDNN